MSGVTGLLIDVNAKSTSCGAGPCAHIEPAEVCFVLPYFRPERCGVSDQTAMLARRFGTDFGLASSLVSVTDCDATPGQPFAFVDATGPLNDAHALTNAFRRRGYAAADRFAVLVQLSLYGYQRRGMATGLVAALHHVRQQFPRAVLGVYFHELWAISRRPWTSSFWLGPLQRRLCERLARIADVKFSNRLDHADWIGARGKGPTRFIPTFSGVGEPALLPEWRARANTLVVFGGAPARNWLYREHSAMLLRFAIAHDLDTVLDIGPDCDDRPARRVLGTRFCKTGLLPAERVSDCLLRSRFGVFEAPWTAMTKSGVFAAYSAHGVVPVTARSQERLARTATSPLLHGRHFVGIRDLPDPGCSVDMAEIAKAAHDWYRQHDSASAAATIVEGLLGTRRETNSAPA